VVRAKLFDSIGFNEFFEQLEVQVNELSDDRRQDVLERIRFARVLMGSPDVFEGIMKWTTPEERLNGGAGHALRQWFS
jgi:hypothetical protein